MPPTISYSFGDVVLVPFPFTDQSGLKTRPAVKRLGRFQQADIRSLRANLATIVG